MQQVKRYIKQGLNQAVDVDLSKFFDTVSHDVLMSRVSRKKSLQRFKRKILKLTSRSWECQWITDYESLPNISGAGLVILG